MESKGSTREEYLGCFDILHLFTNIPFSRVKYIKLATIVKGNSEAPFWLTTTPKV